MFGGVRVFQNKMAVQAIHHPESRVRGGYMNRWLLRKPAWTEYRPCAIRLQNDDLHVHPELYQKLIVGVARER